MLRAASMSSVLIVPPMAQPTMRRRPHPAGRSTRCTLESMATPITVTIPHQLGRAAARRRIETNFAKFIHQLPGGARASSERWDGDRLIFDIAVLGQTVAGVISVLDTVVTMEIELPGVLGIVASGLKDRLQKAGQLLLRKE